MGSNRGPWPAEFNRYFKPRGEKPETTTVRPAMKAEKSAGKADITPHAGSMDTRMAQHLLRRTGFGVSVDEVNAMNGKPVQDIITDMLQEAGNQAMPEPPHWANSFLPPPNAEQAVFDAYFSNNIKWRFEYVQGWVTQLYEGGLRERMTLFWTNHFVTEVDVYFFAPMAYRYLTLMRTHALGNFKQLVHDVGIDPSMLVYLNGDSSVWFEPNENYARELLELFTMGQYDKNGDPNYTQDDIVELSRALTGWVVDYYSYTPVFMPQRFDNLKKNIFGVEDFFEYSEVIDTIFEQRGEQIAHFICSKLYSSFLYDTPDEGVVDALADIFLANNFEIAPVIDALLKSEHFYGEEFRGAKIKSPVDMMIGLMRESGAEQFRQETHEEVYWKLSDLGQQLLQPPNVAGWPGYRDWITTSTLPDRWQKTNELMDFTLTGYLIDVLPLARKLYDQNDPLLVFRMPVALAEHFVAAPADQLGFESPDEDFGGDLVNHPIPQEIVDGPQYVRDLTKIFLQGKPWYEWHMMQPGLFFFMLQYVKFLAELPEFQLK